MRPNHATLVCLLLAGCSTSSTVEKAGIREPLVTTYSIVARDPASGQLGVAVQSHWFSVGSIVTWAEADVGAVATQSLVNPNYGPLGLDMMRTGISAPDALKGLLVSDEGRELRQVAMIDSQGRVMAFTGADCIPMAGQIVDAEHQFSVQANLMEKDTVWDAMAEAYRSTKGDMAARMVAALEAAENEGGDIRGRQSAAMLIVKGESSGSPWNDRVFDLRVEDHPQPVQELKRLVQVQRAYNHMNDGDVAISHGDYELAAKEFKTAEQLAPQIIEIPFWYAVSLVGAGKVDEALPIFHRVFHVEPIWVEVVPRLAGSGLLPDDPDLVKRIQDEAH